MKNIIPRQILLNSDLGERESMDQFQIDKPLFSIINAANISCLAHAGSEEVQRASLQACKDHGIYVGAHPSYPDRQNFGRKKMAISKDDLAHSIKDQLQKFLHTCSALNIEVFHIKPHGALYHELMSNKELAALFLQWAKEVWASVASSALFSTLKFMGLSNSALMEVCVEEKLVFLKEGFADRRYEANGALQSRTIEGSVLSVDDASVQIRSIVNDKRVLTTNGRYLDINFDTICVHGDSPNALSIARMTKTLLDQK